MACAVVTNGGGKLILDFNSSAVTYTGTGDFLEYYTATDSGGPYQTLEIRHLNLWGTSSSTGCGLHTRAGAGMLIHDGTIWNFSGGSAICLENNNGGYQEEWTIRKMSLGYNQKGIRLFQNATTPGTNSFEYSTIEDVHFDLSDALTTPCIGVSIEGIQTPSVVDSNTFGGKWDLAYNINASSNGCALIQLSNGGALQRTDITTRGEQTAGSAQSYLIKIADNYSSVNTPVRPFNGPGPLEMVGLPSGWTGTSCAAAATDQSYGDEAFETECYQSQDVISKWYNHTGIAQGFLKDFLAAPYGQQWGGVQILQRDTSVNGDNEADVIGSGGKPIDNLFLVTGTAIGIGPGFKDYSTTPYPVTSASRSASGSVVATVSVQPTGASTSGNILVEGIADSTFNGEFIPTAVNSTTPPYTVTYSTNYKTATSSGGAIYGNVLFPHVALDILPNANGAIRFGSHNSSGFTGTPLSQLAYFVTASYSPGSIGASSCSDKNVAATGPSGVMPTTADVPISVTSSGTLGNIIVTGATTAIAGDVTLHFCNVTATAISPTAAVYTVVMIH